MTDKIIARQFNAVTIYQRPTDNYIDATAMCKACGKRLQNYTRIDTTQEFLEELSLTTQISVSRLIQTVTFDFPKKTCTFVHPYVAINLAQWLSPKFSVQVTQWVFELLTVGRVNLEEAEVIRLTEWEYFTILQNRAKELGYTRQEIFEAYMAVKRMEKVQ
jgi:hypothetical protein